MLRYLNKAFTISYCLFFASAFFGPALISYSVGGFALFPARILLIPVWVLFLAGILTGTISLKPWQHKPVRWALIFLAGWLVYGLLSLTWALSVKEGIRDIFNMTVGFSVLALAVFLDKKFIPTLFKVWAGMFVASLVIGVLEHLTTLHLPISRLYNNPLLAHVNFRPTGFFDNENNYASFLTLSIPLSLYSFRFSRTTVKKALWGLGLFLGIYLTLVTTSRINYLVLYVLFTIYALVMTEKGRKLRVFTALLILVVATSVFTGVFQPALEGVIMNRLESLYNAIGQVMDNIKLGNTETPYVVRETSIAVRINMVRNGLLFTRYTWGRGVGAGNFELWIENRAYYQTEQYVNPHNWWVELLSEFGILVFLGYLAFLGVTAWALFKTWSSTHNLNDRRYLGIAALSMIALPMVAMSPSSFLTYNPHWLLLALAVATMHHHRVVSS